MLYTIQNDRLTVQINDRGAELWSVKTPDGTEYLWQGDERYWGGRAYNLFPICGRLFEGKYTYKGNTYEMGCHGFMRSADTRAVAVSDTAITFEFCENEQTLAQYPFRFCLRVTYSLQGNTLRHAFEVQNPDAAEELIFSIGGHPGFNVPLSEGERFEDYYVEFDTDRQPQRVMMSEACLDTGRRRPFPLEGGRRLSLRHDLFDDDAIFLTYASAGVTLRSRKSDRYVRVEYPEMNAIGFWHKPKTDAPYVCIEPWYSLPAYDGERDGFETKQLMLHLAAGDSYTNWFDIIIG